MHLRLHIFFTIIVFCLLKATLSEKATAKDAGNKIKTADAKKSALDKKGKIDTSNKANAAVAKNPTVSGNDAGGQKTKTAGNDKKEEKTKATVFKSANAKGGTGIKANAAVTKNPTVGGNDAGQKTKTTGNDKKEEKTKATVSKTANAKGEKKTKATTPAVGGNDAAGQKTKTTGNGKREKRTKATNSKTPAVGRNVAGGQKTKLPSNDEKEEKTKATDSKTPTVGGNITGAKDPKKVLRETRQNKSKNNEFLDLASFSVSSTVFDSPSSTVFDRPSSTVSDSPSSTVVTHITHSNENVCGNRDRNFKVGPKASDRMVNYIYRLLCVKHEGDQPQNYKYDKMMLESGGSVIRHVTKYPIVALLDYILDGMRYYQHEQPILPKLLNHTLHRIITKAKANIKDENKILLTELKRITRNISRDPTRVKIDPTGVLRHPLVTKIEDILDRIGVNPKSNEARPNSPSISASEDRRRTQLLKILDILVIYIDRKLLGKQWNLSPIHSLETIKNILPHDDHPESDAQTNILRLAIDLLLENLLMNTKMSHNEKLQKITPILKYIAKFLADEAKDKNVHEPYPILINAILKLIPSIINRRWHKKLPENVLNAIYKLPPNNLYLPSDILKPKDLLRMFIRLLRRPDIMSTNIEPLHDLYAIISKFLKAKPEATINRNIFAVIRDYLRQKSKKGPTLPIKSESKENACAALIKILKKYPQLLNQTINPEHSDHGSLPPEVTKPPYWHIRRPEQKYPDDPNETAVNLNHHSEEGPNKDYLNTDPKDTLLEEPEELEKLPNEDYSNTEPPSHLDYPKTDSPKPKPHHLLIRPEKKIRVTTHQSIPSDWYIELKTCHLPVKPAVTCNVERLQKTVSKLLLESLSCHVDLNSYLQIHRSN